MTYTPRCEGAHEFDGVLLCTLIDSATTRRRVMSAPACFCLFGLRLGFRRCSGRNERFTRVVRTIGRIQKRKISQRIQKEKQRCEFVAEKQQGADKIAEEIFSRLLAWIKKSANCKVPGAAFFIIMRKRGNPVDAWPAFVDWTKRGSVWSARVHARATSCHAARVQV
nr:PREDICTED: uncharacterized protein LOC105664306 [Megachile rotundata]